MTLLIEPFVITPRFFYVGLWRDHITSALGRDKVANRFGAIGLVAQHIALGQLCHCKQFNCMFGIVVISGREQESNRIAQTIHNRMDFCVQTALGAANRLIYSPFLLPFAL